ncbi:MAG: hypothetical protein JSS27_19410 [Planctomycetes bacterium]|nr:hypothetical protein [Planctomycetota bacterium]
MKCSLCGNDTGRDQTVAWHNDGPSGRAGMHGNALVPMTLCHGCAAKRRATMLTIWVAIVSIPVLLITALLTYWLLG